MNLGDKLLLGVNTTIVSMTIVFIVLIILAYMVVIQSKILKLLTKHSEVAGEVKVNKHEVEADKPVVKAGKSEVEVKSEFAPATAAKTGLTRGEAKLTGIEDEDHVAVVMAAVSNAANIPLTALRIKSIKRIDDTWGTTSKQEQTNQRL